MITLGNYELDDKGDCSIKQAEFSMKQHNTIYWCSGRFYRYVPSRGFYILHETTENLEHWVPYQGQRVKENALKKWFLTKASYSINWTMHERSGTTKGIYRLHIEEHPITAEDVPVGTPNEAVVEARTVMRRLVKKQRPQSDAEYRKSQGYLPAGEVVNKVVGSGVPKNNHGKRL